jgi:flavin-dependent dehydrogenase
VAGDAAGLATVDMGEGIAAAIESGMAAAASITDNAPPSFHHLPRFSIWGMV